MARREQERIGQRKRRKTQREKYKSENGKKRHERCIDFCSFCLNYNRRTETWWTEMKYESTKSACCVYSAPQKRVTLLLFAPIRALPCRLSRNSLARSTLLRSLSIPFCRRFVYFSFPVDSLSHFSFTLFSCVRFSLCLSQCLALPRCRVVINFHPSLISFLFSLTDFFPVLFSLAFSFCTLASRSRLPCSLILRSFLPYLCFLSYD